MFFKAVILFSLTFLVGCATVSQQQASSLPIPIVATQITSVDSEVVSSQEISSDLTLESVEKAPALGFVFAKSDFRGLLKAAYVRLTIAPKDDLGDKFFFYIGDRGNQSLVPWGQVNLIEPGYFYLQLPPGDYQVIALAIPVGSSIAEESMALDFSVSKDQAKYLGTLQVIGISEKIKFGGVPVLQPGFEYSVGIEDNFQEAKAYFDSLNMEFRGSVVKSLFVFTNDQTLTK